MEGASHSALPAAKTLQRLKAEKGVSNRGLARLVEARGGRVHFNTIGNIARGDDKASAELLATLAEALDTDPKVFAEVRLARARRLLDEGEIGLESALANLEVFAAVVEALRERLPEDDRVAHLLEELTETRPPVEGEDAQAGPPGSE